MVLLLLACCRFQWLASRASFVREYDLQSVEPWSWLIESFDHMACSVQQACRLWPLLAVYLFRAKMFNEQGLVERNNNTNTMNNNTRFSRNLPLSVKYLSMSCFPARLYWPCRMRIRFRVALGFFSATSLAYRSSSAPPFEGFTKNEGSLLKSNNCKGAWMNSKQDPG